MTDGSRGQRSAATIGCFGTVLAAVITGAVSLVVVFLQLSDSNGPTPPRPAPAPPSSSTVPAGTAGPALVVSPSAVVPGQRFVITGSGFAPSTAGVALVFELDGGQELPVSPFTQITPAGTFQYSAPPAMQALCGASGNIVAIDEPNVGNRQVVAGAPFSVRC